MARQTWNNIKLGLFVVGGVVLLVLALYMIGRNRSLFTDNFELRARFRSVDGLMRGNNVRYAGIQTGTVDEIAIINDTTIEVTMLINEKTGAHIRKNSVATIGTEGLMGNKVVNITAGTMQADAVAEGDVLPASAPAAIADAMATLYRTNDNAAIITTELVETVRRINNSPTLWAILNDTTLPANLSSSLANVRMATERLNRSAMLIEQMAAQTKNGKNVAGILLSDEAEGEKLRAAMADVYNAADEVGQFATRLDTIANMLQAGVGDKNGMAYALLRDSILTQRLDSSLIYIQKGTAAFDENMEALKHNFLFRGYFKKKNRKQ